MLLYLVGALHSYSRFPVVDAAELAMISTLVSPKDPIDRSTHVPLLAAAAGATKDIAGIISRWLRSIDLAAAKYELLRGQKIDRWCELIKCIIFLHYPNTLHRRFREGCLQQGGS